MNLLKHRSLLLLFSIGLLAACTAPPKRSQADDAAIRSVAVVSVLDEKTPVHRIGLTVFNNKTVVIDQTGVLNDFAMSTVEATLRKARPSWEIKDARAAVPALTARNLAWSLSRSWGSHVGKISSELGALATQLGVDAVFVVIDYQGDKPPAPSVGAYARTMSLNSLNDFVVHADVLLVLVNQKGEQITYRGAERNTTYLSTPAVALGLDYDMSSLSTAEGDRMIRRMSQERLRAVLERAAQHLGYE